MMGRGREGDHVFATLCGLGLGLGLGHPRVTLGSRLGHPRVTLGSRKGRMAEVPLFATKAGKGRVGAGRDCQNRRTSTPSKPKSGLPGDPGIAKDW